MKVHQLYVSAHAVINGAQFPVWLSCSVYLSPLHQHCYLFPYDVRSLCLVTDDSCMPVYACVCVCMNIVHHQHVACLCAWACTCVCMRYVCVCDTRVCEYASGRTRVCLRCVHLFSSIAISRLGPTMLKSMCSVFNGWSKA